MDASVQAQKYPATIPISHTTVPQTTPGLGPICIVQQQQQNIANLHMAVAKMEKELQVR